MSPVVATAKPHILVVEDQAQILDVLREVLEEEHTVTTATTAQAGSRALAASPADLVLLDLMLPGGGAQDVLAQADAKGVPVILMSGNPSEMARASAGERPLLMKPFSLEALSQAVRAALRS